MPSDTANLQEVGRGEPLKGIFSIFKLMASAGGLTDSKDLVCLMAAAGLARRSLLPESLKGSQLEKLIAELTLRWGLPDPQLDGTRFSRLSTISLAAAAKSLEPKLAQPSTLEEIAEIIDRCADCIDYTNPLTTGWSYQCRLMAAQGSPRSQPSTKSEGEYIRENGGRPALPDPQAHTHRPRPQPSDIPFLTQWFTPQWISDFLVEETVGNLKDTHCKETITALDPACGAGHLLVRALEELLSDGDNRQRQSGYSQKRPEAATTGSSKERPRTLGTGPKTSTARLGEILERQLFGLDIDEDLLRLSSFAIYLFCRDRSRFADLPAPHLYAVRKQAANADAKQEQWSARDYIGSLRLKDERRQNSLSLQTIDGRLVPLHDVLPARFSAIVANPPYLSHRLIPHDISVYLKEHYHSAHFDLYAAFLQLGMSLLEPGGTLSMICQQSVLSIQRYEHLRKALLKDCTLDSVVQLGSGSFSAKAGEKVNSAIITLTRKTDEPSADIARNSQQSLSVADERQIKLRRVLAPAEKQRAQLEGIATIASQAVAASQAQSLLNSKRGAPLPLWAPKEVLRLFQSLPAMESQGTGIILTNGLFTCNNRAFVKMHWQVREAEAGEYVPYDKGGGEKWFCTTPYRLKWGKDGRAVRAYRASRGQSQALPGEKYYFSPGVTYSYIGTRGFKARLLSEAAVFDIASSSVFSDRYSPLYLVAYLNSALVRFILGALNPTINFQIGDLRRIPFKAPDSETEKHLETLALQAVSLARQTDELEPVSPCYRGSPLERFGGNECDSYANFCHITQAINLAEQKLQEQIDQTVFDLYEIDSDTRATIMSDPWVTRGNQSLYKIPELGRLKRRHQKVMAEQAGTA